MSKHSVVLAGRMSGPRHQWLTEHLNTPWHIAAWTEDEPIERFAELVADADALVGGRIRGDWRAGPKLRLYQIPFTGYDFLEPHDVPSNCTVCNAYGHEIAIAEYVMAAMLEREIGLTRYDREFKEIGWQGRVAGIGPSHGELHGKTLGIVGFGHIGAACAERAVAFGLRTIGVSRTARPTPSSLERFETLAGIDRLLAESDYVLVTLPLAPETTGLFDAAKLARMKEDAVLINVGRAAVVDQRSLYEALSQRRIGGAILDVWYNYPSADDPEPRPAQFPFWELDNVVMTPHCSSRSVQSRERRWLAVADNLDRLASNQPLANVCFQGTGG